VVNQREEAALQDSESGLKLSGSSIPYPQFSHLQEILKLHYSFYFKTFGVVCLHFSNSLVLVHATTTLTHREIDMFRVFPPFLAMPCSFVGSMKILVLT
jgi:hypothetical protein